MQRHAFVATSIALCALLFAACGSDDEEEITQPQSQLQDCPALISISGLTYSPNSCRVRVGTSVTIPAGNSHPGRGVSTNSNPIPSAAFTAPTAVTFTAAGVYTYECTAHSGVGMTASITVVP
jgi:plastocyanin